jgi:hypothetical protein
MIASLSDLCVHHSTNRIIEKHDETCKECHVISVIDRSPRFQQQAREEHAADLQETQGLEVIRTVFLECS